MIKNVIIKIKESQHYYFIIDDDDDDVELMKEALFEIDPTIIIDTASDGKEGLLLLKSGSIHRPDMIFVDLNMPRMGGAEFLHLIKVEEGFKKIPVVIYSTSSDKIEIKKLIDMGASRFMIKSSEYNDLILTLKSIISTTISA